MHSYVFLFLNIGTPELMFILLAILLLFGGNKLPELSRGLGKGIREFKDASDNVKREIHRNMNEVKQNIEESAQDLNPDAAPKQQDQSSLK